MKAWEIEEVLTKIAPPHLAYKGEELGFIAGKNDREIKVLGVTERPTVKVLEDAVNQKVDMLIIHEPLYHSEKTFLIDKKLLDFIPNSKRKRLVEKGGFAVFRFHSQWDAAKGGNNDTLADVLEIKILENIPYGKIGEVNPVALENFAKDIKNKLGSRGLLVVGDSRQKIKKVAVIAGSGNSMIEMMEYVKKRGVDVMVSGDIQDGRARYAKELGLAVVDAGDYFTENPGMKHLSTILRKKLKKVKVVFLDAEPPWKVI